jgi:hypothetical protein
VRCVVLAVLVALTVGCSLRSSQRRSLDSYILELVGNQAEDCGLLGVFAPEQDVLQAIDCIRRAAARGTFARSTHAQSSVDSSIWTGLLATKTGIVLISYDSAPCGSPRGCREAFGSSPCDAPEVQQNGPTYQFACRSRVVRGRRVLHLATVASRSGSAGERAVASKEMTEKRMHWRPVKHPDGSISY